MLRLCLALFCSYQLCFALSKAPDLDLQDVDTLAQDKIVYESNLSRARELLNSSKMDVAYQGALQEVLKSKLDLPETFQKLNLTLKSEAIKPELAKAVLQYSNLLKTQSQDFYELTKAAHFQKIEDFNTVCQKMIEQNLLAETWKKEHPGVL